ncbi:unnamed protein product [Boreogadus saida]
MRSWLGLLPESHEKELLRLCRAGTLTPRVSWAETRDVVILANREWVIAKPGAVRISTCDLEVTVLIGSSPFWVGADFLVDLCVFATRHQGGDVVMPPRDMTHFYSTVLLASPELN